MSFTLSDDGEALTIAHAAAAAPLATYVYAPHTAPLESPKPYLHPLRTLAGREVTLFRPHDHVWHKGIAWALPNVGELNFWGGPTYMHGRGYVQLDNNGRAEHASFDRAEVAASDGAVGGDLADVVESLDWSAPDGAPVIAERRRLRAALGDDCWMLVVDIAMTNVSAAPLAFGSPTTKGRENAGYGGLFWRGPRSFTDGVVRSAHGDGGDELRGSRHAWLGFTGRFDEVDAAATVVIVDDHDNPRHPPQWFARSEQFACLNPAPFFSDEFELPEGETVRFRYAVVIADGHEHPGGAAQLADQARRLLDAVRTTAEGAR